MVCLLLQTDPPSSARGLMSGTLPLAAIALGATGFLSGSVR
jgi:hypothetical protein